ncbi:conjugal transfer protein [Pseudomonas protegens]|uniref:Conjugal transfer protein n=1 Tax=Pseudomonas protegens TaxID=380021 RepID=A0A2T6GBG9_9PSED|nr:TrbI/VirB10 family protein [Pseudomonas protegens]PUA41499.1 conjugal transfer protein [Pseudomonas protegens]
MSQNNDPLEHEEGQEIDQDSIQAASDTASGQATSQARGAFDLRKGRVRREGKNKLYWQIGAMMAGGIVLLGVVWVIAVGAMHSGATTEVDESQVKGDATLDIPEQDDTGMRRLKEQKVKEMSEAQRLAAAANVSQPKSETKTDAAPSVGVNRVADAGEVGYPSNQEAPPSPRQRKLGNGVVVQAQVSSGSAYNASSMRGTETGTSGMAGGTPVPTALDLLGQENNAPASLDPGYGRASLDQLGGTTFTPGNAVLAPPRKYLLRHNTYTSCVLYTEIITDYPGLIDCRLTEPLYSADGSTVLAEAGDRLTGEQRTEIKPGQARVFTTWTELETASGVRAKLDSLGAGPMGASGTEAWIDNHYKQRFGGAVMLSIIQDSLQILTNRSQKSNSGGYTVNNTENSVQNMADKALENSINMPPTAYILPGTVMSVIVARDIDFSSVYENR